MRRSASLLLLLLLLLLGACDATDRTNVPWTLSQPLSYGPRPTVAAAFDQIPAAVAHNGKTFLLLWYDKRDSIAPSASSGRRIYGTRIDGTLEVLDPTGVQLLDVRDAGLGLVALGDRYLAHHAWRSGGLRTTKLWSIEADLAFTDPDALLWPTNDYEHIPRGAATDGRTMLLVLEAQRNGIDVMGVRLEGLRFEANDRGVHAVPFVIAEGADDQSEPAVACNGSLFLVAYRQHVGDQNDQIELRRVSTDGRVLDAQPITAPSTGNDNWHARVASDGKDFLVVWQRIAGDVLAARVSGDGALLDAAPMALGQGSDSWPAVAHASGRYLVAWRRDAGANGEIVSARVGSDGTVDDAPARVLAVGAQTGPLVGSDGSQFLVAWGGASDTGYGTDVYATTVGADGQNRSPKALPHPVSDQANAVAAWGGESFLLVWESAATGPRAVVAQRLDASGTLIGEPKVLSRQGSYNELPSVVSYDGGYFVTWREKSDIACSRQATRVGRDGQPIDAAPTRLGACTGDRDPALAASGATVAIAGDTNDATLQVHWVDAAASEISLRPVTLLDEPGASHFVNDIAFNGEELMVLYSRQEPGKGGALRALRAAANGAAIDGAGVTVTEGGGIYARLAFGDGTFLVVWRGASDGIINSRRLDERGTPLGEAKVSLAEPRNGDSLLLPRVVFDGAAFAVSWERRYFEERDDVQGTLVWPSGEVTHPGGVTLIAGAHNQVALGSALASDGQQRTLVSATIFDPGLSNGANRVQLVFASHVDALDRGCTCGLDGAAPVPSLGWWLLCVAFVASRWRVRARRRDQANAAAPPRKFSRR